MQELVNAGCMALCKVCAQNNQQYHKQAPDTKMNALKKVCQTRLRASVASSSVLVGTADPEIASNRMLHEGIMLLGQVLKLLLQCGNLSSQLFPVLHQLSAGPLRLFQLTVCHFTLTCQAFSLFILVA